MYHTLSLTPEEVSGLRWVAERYTSAETLYDLLDDDNHIHIPENVAWEYTAQVHADGGGVLPPCIGGSLARKLIRLYLSIV